MTAIVLDHGKKRRRTEGENTAAATASRQAEPVGQIKSVVHHQKPEQNTAGPGPLMTQLR